MQKSKVALLLTALLVGCEGHVFDTNEVSPFLWQSANQLCANQGGVEHVSAKNLWRTTKNGGRDLESSELYVRCQNGVTAQRQFNMKGSEMFREISLKCFRQHRDLTVNLTEGVVAIRGMNEAGKTTILEAIAYALFGAKALREPMAETVTWGEKEAALKVRVDFTLNGVDYRVTRSKSGAEIRTTERIEATGQSEVTKFVETLLGANADVCRNLMMADQQALRGALAKGPSAAIELIEKLANFSLIDTILGLVQSSLPCGTTATVEARIATLEAQVKEPLADDTGPLALALSAAEDEHTVHQQAYNDAKGAYDAVQPAARDAEARLLTLSNAQQERNLAEASLASAKAAHERINPVPGPTEAEIEALRKAAEDAQNIVQARAARAELERLPEPENEWEGSYESLVVERKETATRVANLNAAINDAQVSIARKEAMKITQTACGLCGKDLTDVPEVASKNAAIDAELETLRAAVMSAGEERDNCNEGLAALDGVIAAAAARQAVYQRHAAYITLDAGYVPARWSWSGPDTRAEADSLAAARAYREAADKARQYQQALGQKDQAKQTLDQAARVLEIAEASVAAATRQAEGAQAVLDDAATKTAELNEVQLRLRDAVGRVETARQALEGGRAILAERQRARDALEAQLKDARKELADMQDNNALVVAIRKARPEITDELWDIASASISHHFSAIRGTDSVVTRADNSFKVDGQSIGGLSGSTLDALGLAIRVALTKVFLPNTSFMMLDEPAAAADDQRESNMLGLISTCGFEQVILITHSDLADSFASQVVRI